MMIMEDRNYNTVVLYTLCYLFCKLQQSAQEDSIGGSNDKILNLWVL